MELGLVVAFASGMIILCIIGKTVSLPMKLLGRMLYNSIIGALMLAVVNIFGLGIKITFFKALLAGFLGIPGVLLVVFCHYI